MQAAKMGYKSVYNEKSRCGELCFLLFLREESRKVAFAKTVCLTVFFTKTRNTNSTDG